MTALAPLRWVLCDGAGTPLPGAAVGTMRRLLFARNRASEARLTLSMYDEVTRALFSALRDGIPQLRVYLGDTLVFSGHWTPMQGTNRIDEASSATLVFRDAFDRLYYRWTDSPTYTAQDAGDIARDLIHDNVDLFNAGPAGIATDPAWIQPTVNRDRHYDNKIIADAIIELTEVINPFDWYPTYLDPRVNAGATMRFNVAAHLGADRSDVRFEYGAGTLENCRGYSFATSLPVTRVLAFGTGPAVSIEHIHGDPEALYTSYGLQLPKTDIDDVNILDDMAHDACRDSPVHVTTFEPDPARAPLPWRDFWIGDTVRWNVDDGAMQQQLTPRVQTLEIGVDDSDNVSDVVIGIDPASSGSYLPVATSTRAYVQQQQDLRRRLNALERQ